MIFVLFIDLCMKCSLSCVRTLLVLYFFVCVRVFNVRFVCLSFAGAVYRQQKRTEWRQEWGSPNLAS